VAGINGRNTGQTGGTAMPPPPNNPHTTQSIMANRNLFPVKRLSPSNAFLSAAEGHLSLYICFRPFVWDGETTETYLNIDLYNVLPSPYPRDLAGLQRTFGEIENGFAVPYQINFQHRIFLNEHIYSALKPIGHHNSREAV